MSAADPVLLVLSFEHPTNAVDSVAEAMVAGLVCHGVNAAVCTLPRDLPKLASLPREQVAGLLSLGSLPLSATIEGRPLWEHFPCPVDLYLLDALLYDLARVPAMGRFVEAALGNPRLGLLSPEDGYRRWLGPHLPLRWQQLRFGAFARVQPGAPEVVPQARACVIGTVGGELGGAPVGERLPELLSRTLARHAGAAQVQRLADALQADDAHPMPALTVCDTLGWRPLQALDADKLPALIAVDSWVKRERRLAAVRSLSGVPCDFFGKGWAELLGEIPGFRHVGQIHHEDIAKLLPNYLAVLNFDPNWAHGVHDRVYTAAAMGVRVLTNDNADLAEAGLPAPHLATYDPNRPALAQAVLDAGWLDRLPDPSYPDPAQLARHSWASRMAGWLCAAPEAHPAPLAASAAANAPLPAPVPAPATAPAAAPARPALRQPAHPLLASLSLG